jgi:hypothetical protein
MSPDLEDTRTQWRRAMETTPDCLAVERLMGDLTTAEQEHVDQCARCQAERALAIEFEQSVPGTDDADVQSVVSQLQQRFAATRTPAMSRRPRYLSPWLQLAAGVVLAAGLGYLVWDREPTIGKTDSGVYRSSTISVVGPHGDLVDPPARFEWTLVPGAARYRIDVREVDSTLVWSTTTADVSVATPQAVLQVLVPGKALVWDITALDANGAVVAQSAEQRFRIGGGPSPKRK